MSGLRNGDKSVDNVVYCGVSSPRPDHVHAGAFVARADDLSALQLNPAGLARLRGTLTWRLETEYHERLTEAHVNLYELNAHVDALQEQYGAFVRTRQAATHSYVGYDAGIGRLSERVRAALRRVTIVMARQGHAIESVAINQLKSRRERLVAQQTEARYAVADSYDRAMVSQTTGAGR